MNHADFQQAYAEQNRRDYIAGATVATVIQIPLNLSCLIMDHSMFPGRLEGQFLRARVCSVLVSAAAWLWFKTRFGRAHPQWQVAWIMSPLLMILWMLYEADAPDSAYYAGLNIILLGMGLLTPWAYMQNISVGLFVLATYLIISFTHARTPDQISLIINNTTFLALTSVIVVSASVASARQRLREFSLRWELDKSRRTVEESNRKLLELDQIKSRFFANISHELRTPLTLLIAPLESLMQRFGLDTETKELLGTMHSNGMRLLKLINDLLDLVRLESGRMEVKREPFEVAGFIKGLASAARQVAEDKRLRLETFVDPDLGCVVGDRDKLEKIVLNLVFNALKFTPAGGRVELRAEKQGQEFVLIVADTGMGISEKNLPYVFDRFWQADGSSKRKYQGVGIGLALVKELVEIHGGKVSVASQEGKGATFTVRLPYQKAELAASPGNADLPAGVFPEAGEKQREPQHPGKDTSAPGAGDGRTVTSEEWLANLYRRAELFPALTPVKASLRPGEIGRNGNQPTILVADDEPDMLRFLKSQLSAHYHVLEAVDGQQAVEKAHQFLPDLILLDMMMPEKDGLQACREIREHTPTHSIPIVLLTARADEETKLAALNAGASDFLTKPFSSTELHVRLKNLVESHEYQRQLSKKNQALESTLEQLKDTETQLVQSEKLASLGRMSAGIIHEINNPLNFATTGLFTLRHKGKYLAPEQQEEYAEILKDVEDGIKRVKTIVSDLRMFTHPDTESRDQVEVAEVVTAALRFLSNEWKDKIRIDQHLPERQTIWANKNKLIHVLVNLLQNSLDALKAKTATSGALSSTLSNSLNSSDEVRDKVEDKGPTTPVLAGPPASEPPTIWIEGRVEAGRSLLIVRDNGTGIEAKHLDKIFDPFYTTKDVGEGMGLGLAICYRIVQECDGRIAVRTEPGRFCEFTLEFPAKGRAE